MRTVLAALVLLPALAFADTAKIAHDGFSVSIPPWKENPDASATLQKIVDSQKPISGGAAMYMSPASDPGAGFIAMWMINGDNVEYPRVAVKAAFVAARGQIEGNGKMSKWDETETKTRMAARFEQVTAKSHVTGIITGGVDKDGHLHTWTVSCIYQNDQEKAVASQCKAALDSFAVTFADDKLKPLGK